MEVNESKFIETFVGNLSKVTQKNFIFKDGKRVGREGEALRKWTSHEFLEQTDCLGIRLKSDGAQLDEFFSPISDRIAKAYIDIKKENINFAENKLSKGSMFFQYENFIPVWDLEEEKPSKALKILDNDTYRVTDITGNSWERCVPQEVRDEIRPHNAVFRYNPYDPAPYEEIQYYGTPAIKVNTYLPPEWKLTPEVQVSECPDIIMRFFEHFIPEETCRQYVFERMYMIAHDRLEVFMVFNSPTGTGKGIFTRILEQGVGKGNYVLAPHGWSRSIFNSWLQDKQLVVFDEVKVETDGKDENVNYLKRIVNAEQTVEKKGVDADKTMEVFASYILTNNHGPKNFKMEDDNRRFSVVEMTQKKMEDVFTLDQVNEIVAAVEDRDTMNRFWLWLTANFGPNKRKYRNKFHLWKGELYWKFKYESKPMWQRFLIDTLTNNPDAPEYTYRNLEGMFREYINASGGAGLSFPRKRTAISFFLETYRHMDKDPIGSTYVDKEDGELIVKVDDKFVSAVVKSSNDGTFNFEQLI